MSLLNRTIVIHNVTQGSDDWKYLKAGRFGGTSASAFFVSGDKISKGLESLIFEKAAECVEGATIDGYSSPAMDRGVLLEPYARQRYEAETFSIVKEVGYIEMGDYFGVSPDGLVRKDGAIEIKCPGGKEFVRWMVGVKRAKSPAEILKLIPSSYLRQMQWTMFVTGREWVDYVVYNNNFAPLDYICTRVYRDEENMKILEKKCLLVQDEMNEILNIVAAKEVAA